MVAEKSSGKEWKIITIHDMVCRLTLRTTALVSKKLRESMSFALQATQRVRESEERERWRGTVGVGINVACSEDRSAAEQRTHL